MLHIKQTVGVCYHFHNVLLALFLLIPAVIIPLLDYSTCNNTVHGICWSILYAAGATQAVLVGFYYPPDRDLLFAHVQTSAGLLFCFMTISAGLPWHQGLRPQSLILSSVSKFQTLAESFQYHSCTPKCCHSPFPGHLVLWVQGTSGDL